MAEPCVLGSFSWHDVEPFVGLGGCCQFGIAAVQHGDRVSGLQGDLWRVADLGEAIRHEAVPQPVALPGNPGGGADFAECPGQSVLVGVSRDAA